MLITGLLGRTPEDLDLDTMQLLLHFFTIEELIRDLQLLDLSVRELTIVKAALLQEMAGQIGRHAVVRDAVKARVQTVFKAMRRSPD